jgi:DNA polymerase-3 subunit alpha
MGGIVSSIKLAYTRNPKPGEPSKYANFDLEDLEGITRSIAWPSTYVQCEQTIVPDSIVLIRGRIDKRGEEEINLIVDEVIPIQEADSKFTSGIRIAFDEAKHDEKLIPKIEEILRGYEGDREVLFTIHRLNGEIVHVQTSKRRVAIKPELRERLDDLLGENSHRLIFQKPKISSNGSSDGYRRRPSK